jgi:hypothetical protein
VPVQRQLLRLVHHPHAPATDLAQDLVIPQLTQGRRVGRRLGRMLLARGFRGLGLSHQHQGGQDVADLVGVLGVAPGELLHRGPLPVPERLHELVPDLAEGVRHGSVVVAHRHIPSMRAEHSQPWRRFYAGRRRLSRVDQEPWI